MLQWCSHDNHCWSPRAGLGELAAHTGCEGWGQAGSKAQRGQHKLPSASPYLEWLTERVSERASEW
eukprot:6243300-Alexandrium_andersonii.AAC.1